jgi:hypothetical protein
VKRAVGGVIWDLKWDDDFYVAFQLLDGIGCESDEMVGTLTMRLGLAGSVTASVTDNDHWHCRVDFDVDERTFSV